MDVPVKMTAPYASNGMVPTPLLRRCKGLGVIRAYSSGSGKKPYNRPGNVVG